MLGFGIINSDVKKGWLKILQIYSALVRMLSLPLRFLFPLDSKSP